MNVTFPGITRILSADMIYSVGEQPSRCVVTFVPQANVTANVGDLVIDDGTTSLTFQNAAVKPSSVNRHQPLSWRVLIEDRRWKWRYGKISGHYNRPDGIGGYYSGSEKNPQELATLLLQALGETVYSTAGLPTTPRPEAHWDAASPATELRKLCDLFGCVICLNPQTNYVEIKERETGGTLPSSQKRSNQYSLIESARPQKFVVVGEPLKFQSKFVLEAVGIDTDGAIEELADLAYIPAGGWGGEHPAFFSGVASASRTLAFESVFRYYRIKNLAGGGFVPQGYPNTAGDLTDIDQLLPLEDYLLTADDDPAGNQRRNGAYVEGNYWYKCQDFVNAAASTRFPGTFEIDNDRGLVIFDEPVFKLGSNGETEAADLYLVATHGTKVPKSGPQERYTYSGSDLTTVTTEAQKICVAGLQAAYVGTYSGATPTGFTDNTTSVNSLADAHLSAAHWPDDDVFDAEYGLLQDVQLDGTIHQIRWLLRPYNDPPAATRIWTNTARPHSC